MSVRRRSIVYSGAIPSIVYTDNGQDAGAVTTHTFTGKSIGAASPTRTVLVLARYSSTSTTFSCTIGGNAATLVASFSLGTATHLRLFALNVPTGTTATIVTTSNASGDVFIAVAAAYDLLSTTPTATNGVYSGASSPTADLSLNVAANGVAFGYATFNTSGTFVWTGMTEQLDTTISSISHTVATYTATGAQSPLSVTVTRSANGCFGLSASFR
ncbi:hypothetical protein [Hyphomicrobium sp. ghe19]|uniref:hypothetical protein n=1 Tax=Hyphomicrobium sp. ghe19 TaxID=2682968 RepID=UPI0013668DB2|nr:hypothetical protein HYPP_01527 [Hyphomicrobium sp. ghe19]